MSLVKALKQMDQFSITHDCCQDESYHEIIISSGYRMNSLDVNTVIVDTTCNNKTTFSSVLTTVPVTKNTKIINILIVCAVDNTSNNDACSSQGYSSNESSNSSDEYSDNSDDDYTYEQTFKHKHFYVFRFHDGLNTVYRYTELLEVFVNNWDRNNIPTDGHIRKMIEHMLSI